MVISVVSEYHHHSSVMHLFTYQGISLGQKIVHVYQVFLKDALYFIGTRFGSLDIKIESLESAQIIIGSLESENSGLYRSKPGT